MLNSATEVADLAAIRRSEEIQQAKECRFSGTVRADNDEVVVHDIMPE
jgi:hypothetical protein